MDNTSVKTVTLTLTNSCNLDCIYCYEHNKSDKFMTFETAKSIIDKELNTDDGIQLVNIGYFGGEPFLAFDLIKKIHEYICSRNWSKKVISHTSTNGTLVHDEIQDWLQENKDNFKCGLSFDGTKSMQNYNRSNSFDLIDLKFFKKTYTDCTIKMTVSPKTLETLADGIIFLHQQGFNVSCNLAYGIDWNSYEMLDILDRELQKLITFYINNPNIKPSRILELPIQLIDGKIPEKIKKWCGSGTHMHTYDTDGNCYPCQYFMPLSIGEDNATLFQDSKFEHIMTQEMLSENCKNCILIKVCPTCNGANFEETGNVYHKSKNYCQYIKRILLANSYFKWNQYKKQQLNLTDEEKFRLLRGISVIQKECI